MVCMLFIGSKLWIYANPSNVECTRSLKRESLWMSRSNSASMSVLCRSRMDAWVHGEPGLSICNQSNWTWILHKSLTKGSSGLLDNMYKKMSYIGSNFFQQNIVSDAIKKHLHKSKHSGRPNYQWQLLQAADKIWYATNTCQMLETTNVADSSFTMAAHELDCKRQVSQTSKRVNEELPIVHCVKMPS